MFLNCDRPIEKNSEVSASTDSVERYIQLMESKSVPIAQKLEYAKRAHTHLKKRNDDSTRSDLLKITDIFYRSHHLDDYLITTKTLLQKSIESKDTLSLAASYKNLGYYFVDTNQSDSAYFYFFKSKKFYFVLNDKKGIADISYAIARLQFSIGDFTNSEKSLFKALDYNRNFNNDYVKSQYMAYNLLGVIYCELKEPKKSIEYHNIALKLLTKNEELSDTYFKATTLNNIGNVFQYCLKDYKKALKFYSLSCAESRMINDPSTDAMAKDNLAYCFFKLGNFEKLPFLFYESLKIRDSLKINTGSIVSNIHLSEYYAFQKDTVMALSFAEKAKSLAIQYNLPAEKLFSYQQLVALKHTNSPAYSKEYIRISDSLQLAERKIRNKFARIAYETEEISQEKQIAVKHKWIIVGVGGSFILFGILLFVIKTQRARQKELEFIHEQQKSNESIYQLINDQQTKVDEARLAEKKRIALELRDGVMNRLSNTRLNLFILDKKQDERTIEKCFGYIDDLQVIEKEIRQVAHDLTNDVFSGNKSFNTILQSLFDEQRLITDAKIQPQIDECINWESIDSKIKMNLYRILQDALINCNKYAKPKNVYITINREENILLINIHDDGIGFSIKKTKASISIKNMSARIKSLSGRIDILSQKENGTTIIVNLPITTN